MRAIPLAMALAIVVPTTLAIVPTANADGLWQCDASIWEILAFIQQNLVPAVMYVVGQYTQAAGKTKCTALETLGICSDEGLGMPQSDARLGGVLPGSTGKNHPHRGLCNEYFFGQYPNCPTGRVYYVEHRFEPPTPYDGGFHTHTPRCL